MTPAAVRTLISTCARPRWLLASLAILVPIALSAAQPPAAELVLWLKADTGITADADGLVSAWLDQSPQGHHAGPLGADYGPAGTELPLLVTNAVNGLPAVRFDGVDDVLEIPNSPGLQPGDGGWTVIFVGRHAGPSAGDFPQIIGSRPWLAGLDSGWAVSLDNLGRVTSHFADGTAGHDVPDARSGQALATNTFEMWLVEEDRAAGRTTFYRQGDPDRLLATAMPTAPILQDNPVHLGREMGGANNRRANVELAEVLVYRTVLSPADRLALSTYLSDRFGFGFTGNQPPSVALTAPAGGSSVSAPANVELVASASDADGGIARVEFYENDRLLATASAPPFRAPWRLLSPATLTFSAVAVDDRGARATSAPVAVTVIGSVPASLPVTNGLQLALRADLGVSAGGDGLVSRWEDQSPQGNHAGPLGDAYGPLGTEAPALVADAVNGRPAVRFDGEDDVLEIPNAPSLQPGTNDWTVWFVGRRMAASRGDFPQVIGSRPWTAGADKGWAVAFGNNGRIGSHFADGTIGHDVPQIQSASAFATTSFQVWQVEEARAAGTTRFFLGGSLDAMLAPPMPAAPLDQEQPVHLGREMGGADSRRANLELAEVLVFNRVLDATEREVLTVYLSGRYGLPALASQNQPPTVALTGPAAGAEILLAGPVTLAASAADVDGSVVQVEFLSGTRTLGLVTNAPFTLVTTNLPVGDITLRVRATDNLGAVTDSAPVAVTTIVLNPPRPLTLIAVTDYSDSFTVGPAGSPAADNPRPNGMYNNDSFDGYAVENTGGNPPAKWTPTANFSFNTPDNTTGASITTAALGNPGAATGLAQSGGGDFSFAYGLRSNFVVQVDAILPLDRLDVGSYAAPGDAITAAQGLTVFFRRDTAATPGISLYRGTNETAVTDAAGQAVKTGVTDQDWHRFGVHFDAAANRLGIYVDGFPKAVVDLKTFAGGGYADLAAGAVGVGGAGFNGTHAQWFDNFAVGAPALVGAPDYSDSFTVTNAPRRDGLFNNNSEGAYTLEHAHGNPPATWTPINGFSFNTPGSSTGPAILEAATGNPGAATGLAQSGSGDFSLPYGLRDDFVVAVDAVLPLDRLDISSWPEAGAGLGTSGGLTVFLRRDSSTLPGIGLSDGGVETGVLDDSGVPVKLGVDDMHWHGFAVRFHRAARQLTVFADGVLKARVDLATFAGGRHAGFAANAVGIGGTGFNGTHAQWFDNFVVGQPGPGADLGTVAGPLPFRLDARRDGPQLVLEWTGAAILESTPAFGSPWNAVPAASSPYRVNSGATNGFFRLKR